MQQFEVKYWAFVRCCHRDVSLVCTITIWEKIHCGVTCDVAVSSENMYFMNNCVIPLIDIVLLGKNILLLG